MFFYTINREYANIKMCLQDLGFTTWALIVSARFRNKNPKFSRVATRPHFTWPPATTT